MTRRFLAAVLGVSAFAFITSLAAAPFASANDHFYVVDIKVQQPTVMADGLNEQTVVATVCDPDNEVDQMYFMNNHRWDRSGLEEAGLVRWNDGSAAIEIGGANYGNQFFELGADFQVSDGGTDLANLLSSGLVNTTTLRSADGCSRFRVFKIPFTYDGFYYPQSENRPSVNFVDRDTNRTTGWIRVGANDTLRQFDITFNQQVDPIATLHNIRVHDLGNREYEVAVSLMNPQDVTEMRVLINLYPEDEQQRFGYFLWEGEMGVRPDPNSDVPVTSTVSEFPTSPAYGNQRVELLGEESGLEPPDLSYDATYSFRFRVEDDIVGSFTNNRVSVLFTDDGQTHGWYHDDERFDINVLNVAPHGEVLINKSDILQDPRFIYRDSTTQLLAAYTVTADDIEDLVIEDARLRLAAQLGQTPTLDDISSDLSGDQVQNIDFYLRFIQDGQISDFFPSQVPVEGMNKVIFAPDYLLRRGETIEVEVRGVIDETYGPEDLSDRFAFAFNIGKVRGETSGIESSHPLVLGQEVRVSDPLLHITPSREFEPVTLIRGGVLQKLGSFDLRAELNEDLRVTSMRVRGCFDFNHPLTLADCNNVSSTPNIQFLQNITLADGEGNVLSPSQHLSNTQGATFSTNVVIPAGEVLQVDVWGTLGLGIGAEVAADRLAMALSVPTANGVDSQVSFSGAEALGQERRWVDQGTLAIDPVDSPEVFAQVLHANEVDVPVFAFQARATDHEDILLKKVYLGVRNGDQNTVNYKLFVNGQQVGITYAQPNDGEVRFTGLSERILRGESVDFVVTLSLRDAMSLSADDNEMSMGVTFLEYAGFISGITTRDSGGIAIAAPGNMNRLYVHDAANFETGDQVKIDWNNDGQFTSFLIADFAREDQYVYVQNVVASGNEVPSSNGYVTLSYDAEGELPIDLHEFSFIPGGNVTLHSFFSPIFPILEIEPSITAFSRSPMGNPTQEDELFTHRIENQGVRTMQLNRVRFMIEGNYDVDNGYGPRAFRLDRADSRDGVRLPDTMNQGVSLDGATLVYHPSNDDQLFNILTADVARGERVVSLDGVGTLVPGDRVSFSEDNNGGIGYRVTRIQANTIEVTPALQRDLTADSSIFRVFSYPRIDDDAVLEPGQTIEFDILGSGLTEEIAGGEAKGYVLLADTTNMRDLQDFNDTPFVHVMMNGSPATVPQPNTNALTWQYLRTADAATVVSTLSDSYPVSGAHIQYN